MAFVNSKKKEITLKIVYYGPPASGKGTCLDYIYRNKSFGKKGELITLDTDGDKTLFFDFIPAEEIQIKDFLTKIQLFTVTGNYAYNTTCKIGLNGADGVVYVADSQEKMKLENTKTFKKFKENLKANNLPYSEMPLIFLYNKRDLEQILPMNILNSDLNPENRPFFPTVAETGMNIFESLDAILYMAINNCKKRITLLQNEKTQDFWAAKTTPSFLNKNSLLREEIEEIFSLDDLPQPGPAIQTDIIKAKNNASVQPPIVNEVDFPIHIKMPENRDEIKVNLNFKERIITIS